MADPIQQRPLPPIQAHSSIPASMNPVSPTATLPESTEATVGLGPQGSGFLGPSLNHVPTTAQAGLQFCALASITSADSVLRDLPSLTVAFHDFEVAHARDPAIRAVLAQEGLSQYSNNFEREYLKSIVASANVDNIRFQEAAQITSSQESFIPQFDFPLANLSEAILEHCTLTQSHSGSVQQLPRVDPYATLLQLRQTPVQPPSLPTSLPATLSSTTVDGIATSSQRGPSSPRAPSSQKRSAHDGTDDELEKKKARAPKKIKSRPASSAADPSNAKARQSSPAKSGTSIPIPRPTEPTQDLDPVSDFEDTVSEFLERPQEGESNEDGTRRSLTLVELRHLERSVSDLSGRGLIAEVQIDTMATLLRYLDRSMSHFDSLEILENDGSGTAENTMDSGKNLSGMLDGIVLSLQHASLSLVILNAKGLAQHLFPEELLLTSLSVFKTRLEKFLAPALEFSKEDNGLSKGSAVFKGISENDSLKRQMLSLVRITCDIAEKLRVTGDADLSDDIVVKFVYIALSLFFIDTSSEMIVGLTEAESLKQAGSSLMRLLFAKHQSQRSWILEEILSLLIKLPHGKKVVKSYRLTDGSRIHASSALLLQLVHMCAENTTAQRLPVDFQELPHSTQRIELQKIQDSMRSVMEGAKSSVGYIFNILLSRCTKPTKSSLDADYRAVLDALLNDLLTVLGHPEWPSAELYLFLFSKAMARFLDDSKADSASRIMAVDCLGSIAAKVKTISNELEKTSEQQAGDDKEECRPFYGELTSETKITDVLYLQASYSGIVRYLGSQEANDSALRSAKNSWIAQWLLSICSATTKDVEGGQWNEECWNTLVLEASKCWKLFNNQEHDARSSTPVIRKTILRNAVYLTSRQSLFLSFDMLLSRILMTLESGAITLRAKALKALSLIVIGDYGVLSQQNVRKTVALRLQDQSSSVRDAAVEMVGKYMVQDAKIRRAYYDIVTDRISDTGLNVRKRVIRLLRDMYSVSDGAVTKNDISQKLLLRVNDGETSVRELALKSVSEVVFGQFISVTAATAEEQGDSRRPAHDGFVSPSQKREVSRRTRTLVDMVGQLSAQQDEAFGSVITNLLKKERGHHNFDPVAASQDFGRACVVIVDCLVDLVQTLQDEDAPKSAVTSTVHTLFTFVRAEPRLVDAKHLGSLLVYLHCSTTSEDWRITMFVLRIFQSAVPVVKDVSAMDAQTAERLSLALVAKCPVVLLPEAVSVLCLIVRLLTSHSMRICKFFQTCVGLLSTDAQKLLQGQSVQENKTRRLMTIVGLLCQHFPFSQTIADNPKEPHLEDLKASMSSTTEEHVFNLLVSLCVSGNSGPIQQGALQSLGFVFLSFPALMNSPHSHRIMDAVFSGGDSAMKIELLSVCFNFLAKIQSSSTTPDEAATSNSLIAKAEDHMGAGVGSSIMQRYLDRVLQCALLNDRALQGAAIDVIGQVTSQALVHPVLCMPVAVALEASDDPVLSDRAFKIHRELHDKHASLIYSKSSECVRTLYLYRNAIGASADTLGYRVVPETNQPKALLDTMYGLASEKRQTRNALLSGLVKTLDVDLTVKDVQVDGDYARFIAENLAYLQYRTMEEVYLVIFYLNRIIAGTGMTLLESLLEMASGSTTLSGNRLSKKKPILQTQRRSKGGNGKAIRKGKGQPLVVTNGNESGEDVAELSGPEAAYDGAPATTTSEDDREPVLPLAVMAKASVAVEAAIALKSYLKRNYDMSESKCQQFQISASMTHKEKPQARYKGSAARLHWQWKANEVSVLCGRSVSEGVGPKAGGDAMMKWQLARFRELIEAETVQRIRDEDILLPTAETRKRRGSSPQKASASMALSRKGRGSSKEMESGEDEEGDEDDTNDDEDESDLDQI
ncbi:cohesin loading factor subunit SCC2 [Entomortierella parvispora]|uniref:Sister chromatid cohesion protein n=1 Tax=Entomortierella parvispora TaxID=205924 RepID=A0A9P3H5H0_9FUNG|nr:cohesin loading factor subunit SCC2 [Entomortierella parvispora]